MLIHRLVIPSMAAAGLLAAACGGDSGELPTTRPVPASCAYAAPAGPVLYVATNGSDETGDGSEATPWASITHALDNAADGSTILVQPGTYTGPIRLRGAFAQGVTLRSAEPYQARLRAGGSGEEKPAVFCYGCEGITIEGFDIAHSGDGAYPLVIQISSQARAITLRNNIIHDSYNNDLLKVNDGATEVFIERNLFYNQQGSDEHIDINGATDVQVLDNVFLNHFAASGRENGNNTSAYIVIKDSAGLEDDIAGSQRIVVARNVFLNWEGSSANNYVLLGEDGADYLEAQYILIENNLFLGNSANPMQAPLGVKSAANAVFRNNTVAGDLPATAYAMRVNTENRNVRNRGIRLHNNIWSDPTGTMDVFGLSPPDQTSSFTLDANLYWNGSSAIPEDESQLINLSDDAGAIQGDPRLGDQSEIVVPTWNADTLRFTDGSDSTCGVHEQLVMLYGVLGDGSAAIDKANTEHAPDHDILGRMRTGSPDIGAYER